MPKSFTYSFNRKGAQALQPKSGEPLFTIYGRRFHGIEAGDYVYVVSRSKADVLLHCQLIVDQVDTEQGQIQASQSTPIQTDQPIPQEFVSALSFQTGKTKTGLRINTDGKLDPQTLRGVRRLSDSGANVLAQLVAHETVFESTRSYAQMRALSVRQPWAELILQGTKTLEIRKVSTRVRERILLYASPMRYERGIEKSLEQRLNLQLDPLVRGVLVGSVRVVDCRPASSCDNEQAMVEIGDHYFAWQLADPKRAGDLQKPLRRPQPIWFYPFQAPKERPQATA